MSRDSDLGWAAGIVDGEGCILLYETPTTFVLRVAITNTSLTMLARFKEIVGVGNIFPKREKNPNPKHRQQYYYEACSRKAEAVLRLLEPYLVNKREEARVGLFSRTLIRPRGVNDENPNMEELAWLKRQLSDLKRTP